MINRFKEDKRFHTRVLIAYRLSGHDRYYTHKLYEEKQESGGEIYTVIDRFVAKKNLLNND